MGRDKADIVLGNDTMATWVANAMNAVFDRTVVLGRTTPTAGLEPVPDDGEAHRGPLSGLVSALAALERPIVMVAVDQPLVRPETIENLASLASSGVTAVCIDDMPQVTCAAYTPDLLEAAQAHLESGSSIRRLLDEIPLLRIERAIWQTWGEDGRSWYSMDSQNDIVQAEHRFHLNLLS